MKDANARKGRRAAAPVVAISVGALLLGVWAWTPSSSATEGQTSGQSAAEASTPVVKPPAVRPAALPFVADGAPQWISIEPSVLARTGLYPGGIQAIHGVVLPNDNRPAWRADSNPAGTKSSGTVFIVGHNYNDDAGMFVPFSTLEKVHVGNKVTLGVPAGTLTYNVEQMLKVKKKNLANRTDLMVNVPGRLVLITCDTVNGDDTYDNLIVIAQLESAVPAVSKSLGQVKK